MRTLILLSLAALIACPGEKADNDFGAGGGETGTTGGGDDTGSSSQDDTGSTSQDDTGSTSQDDTGEGPPPVLKLTSSAFADGGTIPLKHVCSGHGGDNISPHLAWENAPESASLSIIMDDEVSPCGTGDSACKHWAVFNIPAGTDTVPEGFDASTVDGVVEGQNYTGSASYAGPCPPNVYVYKISIYVLKDSMPVIEPGVAYTRSQFESAFASEILATDTIEGLFDPTG
jgi:Raf kinase inhibitor-like YbhB/YbcL family protein